MVGHGCITCLNVPETRDIGLRFYFFVPPLRPSRRESGSCQRCFPVYRQVVKRMPRYGIFPRLARTVLYTQVTQGWFEKLDRSREWDRDSSDSTGRRAANGGVAKGGRNVSCGSLLLCGIVLCMERKTEYTPTEWAVHIGGALLLPAAFLFGRLLASQVGEAPVVCFWRRLFGWRCIGCGMTRALCLSATGQWRASIRANWLILPLMVVTFWICVSCLLWLIRACNGKVQC